MSSGLSFFKTWAYEQLGISWGRETNSLQLTYLEKLRKGRRLKGRHKTRELAWDLLPGPPCLKILFSFKINRCFKKHFPQYVTEFNQIAFTQQLAQGWLFQARNLWTGEGKELFSFGILGGRPRGLRQWGLGDGETKMREVHPGQI